MADVITRFKLETTQYDSKLRDAAKGLKEFTHQAQLGGKNFTDFSQKATESARALGTVASGAMNTKEKVRDLVGAYNEAAKAYNSLNQAQQQTDFGKNLAASLETLKGRITEAKQELYGLGDAMSKSGGGGLFAGLGDKMSGMLQVFGGNLLAEGVSKLTSELAGSVQESIELARQGEGIRMAFERLNRPGLLDELKAATHGTVSEIELMQQAIKFENFKLPVEDLANYLAFAQQKAKDTGESIDYLVNSIVTGLGRQSKQILDNLGISASELTKRMNEGATMTQAVSDIIREEMAKAGDYVETAADRAARATADTKNKMEELGRSAMPVAEEWANVWNEIKIGGMTVLTTVLGPIAESIRDIRELLSGEYELKIKANIPNLADGPQPLPSKAPGTDHKVVAPGGYVQVTDKNTGAVIGGRHFDNLQDSNAIKDWQRGLFKNGGGRGNKKNNLPEYDDFAKQSAKSMLNTDELKKGAEMLSPYQMMLPEIRKNILDIKDADLGGAMAKLGDDKVKKEIEDMTKSLNSERMAFGLAGQAASAFGSALSSIDDPGAKAAGTVMQAIASIALGFATASAQPNTAGTGWGWLAWIAAGMSAMATTIATVHSLTGYAQGGMIKGNSYSGDNIGGLVDGNQLVGLNAGEVVLNAAQQNTLAQSLQGNAPTVRVVGKISGTDIILSADRTLMTQGKQLAVWGM